MSCCLHVNSNTFQFRDTLNKQTALLSPRVFRTVDSNLEFLCERKRKQNWGSEFGRKMLFRSGLEPGDSTETIRHCGASTERDLWQMRAGPRGPPLRKTSTQSTIHKPGPFCHLWSERRTLTKASNSSHRVLNLQWVQRERTEEDGTRGQTTFPHCGVS